MILNSGYRWAFRASALLFVALITLPAGGASAQLASNAIGHCWEKPSPETLEEMFKASGNGTRAQKAQAAQHEPANAVLLISNGLLKTSYSAGLLVGWGETGGRPRFAAITAVGTSALIAPFAFIGPAGDQAIADIFNCETKNLDELAEHAASLVDETVLAAIAREQDAGRRLFVALPGSAARPETVWDLGLLAKSRQPGAVALARNILRATSDVHTTVEVAEGLKGCMQIVPKNFAFTHPGTGQEFLFPPQLAPAAGAGTRYFLIHNDRLFGDESAEYIRSRGGKSRGSGSIPALMPGYDVVRQVLAAKGSFLFASTKTASGLSPAGAFDLTYLRGLFHHAYRQGRMGKEWTAEFPGLTPGASGL